MTFGVYTKWSQSEGRRRPLQDLPLLYSFFYAVVGGDGTEFTVVAASPSASYAGALLPQGSNNASEVEGIAAITDQLGAAASSAAVALASAATVAREG